MQQDKRLVLTATYYVSFILYGLSTAVFGPTLPALAQNTQSRLDQIGLIFASNSLGYILGAWFGGRLCDRFPGHRLIMVALLLLAVTCGAVPLSTNLWLLLALMFMLGLAQGGLDVGFNSFLLRLYGAKSGPYLNGLHFFFGVGALCAPLVVACVLAVSESISWAYWLFALISLPLAFWVLVQETPTLSAEGRQRVGEVTLSRGVFLIASFFFLYVGAEAGYANWLYTYALSVGLADQISAAYLTSAFWSSFTLARLLGVWVSTRVKAQQILVADLLGGCLGLLPIFIWPDSVVVLWISTIVFGVCLASIFPTMLALVDERICLNARITGVFMVGSGLGGILLPWAIGYAFIPLGPFSMMLMVLIAALLCFLLAQRILRVL